MTNPLQNQEFTDKIEQPAKVLATPDGPNRNLMYGASRMADYGYYPDSIGEINPEQTADKITYSEYLRAPQDRFEGWRYAMAACRKCGDEVRVLVHWQGNEVQAASSGIKLGCEDAKCGDNMPSQILRMALPPAESRQGFRSIGDVLKGAGLL